MTTPRVHGDEYLVDCKVEITNYVVAGESVTAAQLGLSRINAAIITGQETVAYVPHVKVDATSGQYPSGTGITIILKTTDASDTSADLLITAADSVTDIGFLNLRVYGIL
tara:strand:- start:3078 stop:3407 length:330 start_codon:yes stop_codon:yes gene_type:complete